MKILNVEKLIIKNFRSILSETILFPLTNGFRVLSGRNVAEPRLGANGSGKSSLWDALCWCFYGTSIKGLRTSSLVTWGQEKIQVTALINISGVVHNIYRGGPPMVIAIDGINATQADLDILLGLTKHRFLHSVMFGQGIPLFPDLSITERGELLNEVLDLAIWQRCSDKAGEKQRLLEKDVSSKESELAFVMGKLTALPTEESLQKQSQDFESQRAYKIAATEKTVAQFETERAVRIRYVTEKMAAFETSRTEEHKALEEKQKEWHDQTLVDLEGKAKTLEDLEGELAPLAFEAEYTFTPFTTQINVLKQKLTENNKNLLNFTVARDSNLLEVDRIDKQKDFWNNNTCPTCSQPITPEFKKDRLVLIEQALASLVISKAKADAEIKRLTDELRKDQEELTSLQDIASRESQKAADRTATILRLKKQIEKCEHEAEILSHRLEPGNDPFTSQMNAVANRENPYHHQEQSIREEPNIYERMLADEKARTNPYLAEIDKLKKDTVELTDKANKLEAECNAIEANMIAAEYWKHGFKRIRLYFINQVLAALQIEIQSAVSTLGLDGWRVCLSTESETKSGTTKLGVQIHIYSPVAEGAWEVWSGGESQRLRLAIADGLSSLIQRAAGVWFGFEVWDEPTNWLGSEGIEDLLEDLQYRCESRNKSIWLVDHRAFTFSGFNEIWMARKEADVGTKISRVAKNEVS